MKAPTNNKSDSSKINSNKPFIDKSNKATFLSQSGDVESPFISPSVIQPKLSVGQPGDKYEQEADQMAENVVQENTNQSATIQPMTETPEQEENLQKKEEETNEEAAIDRKPVQEDTSDSQLVQGKDAETASPTIETQLQSSKGGGQSLDHETQGNMEQSFGADFTKVKTHTDSNAVQMNQELGSKAFTNGSDVYFNSGNYQPDTKEGKKLLAHELTHVVQQNGTSGAGKNIQMQTKKLTKLQELDKEINYFQVNESKVISLLGQLSVSEKKKVLHGNFAKGVTYKAKIAAALNIAEMVKAVKNLTINKKVPSLETKLKWIKAAGTPNYKTIQPLITGTKDQTQKNALKTTTWRTFFVSVCDNETILTAVKDLNFDLSTKLEWISHEIDRLSNLEYSDIQSFITATKSAKELKEMKKKKWKLFFLDVCTNETILTAVDDLKFDLVTKLQWMLEEGTKVEEVQKRLKAATLAEVLLVKKDVKLAKLLKSEFSDVNVLAERLAMEVLKHIQDKAKAQAKKPPAVSKTSNFYKVLKDKYLKDYLAAPSAAKGKKAVDAIGKPMETRKKPSGVIEVKPDGGAWRPAKGHWERGAELFWNKQKVPQLPAELKKLPMFKNIKTLPKTLAAGTGVLTKENLAVLPYLDVPFLLGKPNTGSATLDVDVIKGGKNLSQVMHWATGVKSSDKSPQAIRELFLAYEKWHLEGWDVFGQDALNDLIAEEQGRLLGVELRKGAAGAIKKEADLLPFLNKSFQEARAWVGALLRLRKTELDEWILSKEQKKANMHWGKLGMKKIWHSDTVYEMLASGKTLAEVQATSFVKSQIEIYTLLFEADEWEAKHGAIVLTELEKALVEGKLDKILAWSAKGGGASGAGDASDNRKELQGKGGGS